MDQQFGLGNASGFHHNNLVDGNQTLHCGLPGTFAVNPGFQQPANPTQNIDSKLNYIQESSLTQTVHVSQYGSLNPTFDAPMSFRDRHRFLDGVYNTYFGPENVSAKNLEIIAKDAGLSMEEVLSWFEDEKGRRAKLLARTQLSEQINQQFPLSPAETGINTTTTLRSSQLLYTATPIAFPEIDDIFSPSPIVPLPKATRGRPSKTQSRPATSFASPESKRQRFLSDYPCPDCGKLFPAERWSEHVKRVHFPDQIWECQKIDAKTGKRCASKPFFRVDNFETHIKKQHRCNEQEVHQLKASWKYVVVDFFHKVCGICGDILNTRENSIEHIREHFKCISQRSQPPIDCGLSEWQEQCHTDHHLRRGIHYQLDNKDRKTLLGNINNPDDEHDSEDEDDDDDRTGGSGGSGSSYGSPRNSKNTTYNCTQQYSSSKSCSGGSDNSSHFYASQESGYSAYNHCSTPENGCMHPDKSVIEGPCQVNYDNPDFDPKNVDGVDTQESGNQPTEVIELYPHYDVVGRAECLTKVLMPDQKQDLPKVSSFGLEDFQLPFNFVRKLGSGGHGIVDEVKTASYMMTFARKSVLRRRKVSSSSHMIHLKNELSILKELEHPNLVRLIGAYTDDEYSHIIMAPVADQNLADYMRSREYHKVHHLAKWMGDLSSAVAYLHTNSVKHLDIKPQNILIYKDNILLADFGAARSVFKEEIQNLQDLALTPMYCAPETKLLGKQEYSADIFSLGCVFSEIVTRYYGRSLQEFEHFRANDDGSTEFHLTIGKTSIWLVNIAKITTQPSSNAHSLQLMQDMLPVLASMLSEAVRDRPTAQDIYIFFADHEYDLSAACPSRSAGSSMHNTLLQSTVKMGTPERPRCETSLVKQTNRQENFDHLDHIDCQECDGYRDELGSSRTHAQQCDKTTEKSRCNSQTPREEVVEPVALLPSLKSPDHVSLLPTEPLTFSPISSPIYISKHVPPSYQSYDKPLYPATDDWEIPLIQSFGASYSGFGSPENCSYRPSEFSFGETFSPGNENFVVDGPTTMPCGLVDPGLIHPPWKENCHLSNTYPQYPPSPRLSQATTYPSPYRQSVFPYPPISRQPVSRGSYHVHDHLSSGEDQIKGQCAHPDCGKVYKDLKAHMLTHQNERPEKCPVQTCEYHTKGFARKYDKNRHTLTHYRGTMICTFCPGSGSAAEKSFNRADVFKRHLTSIHGVQQTPPNSRKKSSGNSSERLAHYAPDTTGKCSTCSIAFANAQDFYEHLDDCVLRVVQGENTSKTNPARTAKTEQDPGVQDTLRNHSLATNIRATFLDDNVTSDGEETGDIDDDHFSLRVRSTKCTQKGKGSAPSYGGLTRSFRKRNKNYPSTWGTSTTQTKLKKRVCRVFDPPRRYWKDEMILDTDYEVFQEESLT